jgi:hypothetical protein
VCDVDRDRRDSAAARVNKEYGNTGCKTYGDFRELNRRTDIDAVFICTPDHWHALIAIDAMRHGKDVYIEKPMTLTIEEGRALVAGARKYQRVAQHGTQHRSMKRFHDVAEFVRNNGLGQTRPHRLSHPAEQPPRGATWKPEPVPANLDWDLWLGPAPWRPYTSKGVTTTSASSPRVPTARSPTGARTTSTSASGRSTWTTSGPVSVEGHGEFPSSGLFTNATNIDFTVRYANGIPMHCRTRFEAAAPCASSANAAGSTSRATR